MASSYLIHYNHNHDKLGRFARSTGSAASAVGGTVTGKKKQKVKAADIKKGKAANTKLSRSERERIVNSGSAKEVAKNKERLSTRELETAVNRLRQESIKRIDLEKKLSDISNPEGKRESVMQKIDRYATTLDKMSNTVEKGVKFYNSAARIHNAMSPAEDAWPLVGEKKKPGESKKQKDYNERAFKLKEYKTRTSEIKAERERKQAVDEYNDYVRDRSSELEKRRNEAFKQAEEKRISDIPVQVYDPDYYYDEKKRAHRN